MIDKITEVLANKISIASLLAALSEVVQHDVENMTWAEVEQFRTEIQRVRKAVNKHIDSVESIVLESSEDWKSQWDLANTLYQEVTNSTEIKKDSVEVLVKYMVDNGLTDNLAESVAESIVFPYES